jgi:multiple sugar transport system substrate-binding protein
MSDGEANELFYSGKAAMWQGGSWFFGEAPTAMAADLVPEVVVAGFPLPSGSTYTKPTLVAGFDAKGVFITRNGAKKLDAIKRLIQYLYQGKNIAGFVETAGMPSPLIDTSDVDQTKLSPFFAQSLAWGDSVTPLHFYPSPAGVDTSQVFQLAWQPDSTAEQIVAAFDQAYEEGMSK